MNAEADITLEKNCFYFSKAALETKSKEEINELIKKLKQIVDSNGYRAIPTANPRLFKIKPKI